MINLSSQKNKKIGIFGLARTGEAAFVALHNIASTILCWDDSEQNRTNFVNSHKSNYLIPITEPSWQNLDYIILSPGVPTTFPEPHAIVHLAKTYNIPIISDIDLLYEARPDARFIGITGTNGKSTTTALIHHILKDKDYDIGGNIGTAALSLNAESRGYVLELSSFQLEITHNLQVDIGMILNITPDHLDRHGTLENYIFSKKTLIEKLKEGGTAILNVDNKITRELYNDMHISMKHINFIRISTKRIIDKGICVKGGKIFDTFSGKVKEYSLPFNKSLQGDHNHENIAAAYAAGIASGVDSDRILEKIATFIGLPHRMQFICTKKNVDFYNDSKATNSDAASKSISALENIYWIAGGIHKEGGIEDILELLPRHVKKAYLFGAAKNIFAQQIGRAIPMQICEDMQEALKAATSDAFKYPEHANILLAPACASYDQFKNYEDRGNQFVSMVTKL